MREYTRMFVRTRGRVTEGRLAEVSALLLDTFGPEVLNRNRHGCCLHVIGDYVFDWTENIVWAGNDAPYSVVKPEPGETFAEVCTECLPRQCRDMSRKARRTAIALARRLESHFPEGEVWLGDLVFHDFGFPPMHFTHHRQRVLRSFVA